MRGTRLIVAGAVAAVAVVAVAGCEYDYRAGRAPAPYEQQALAHAAAVSPYTSGVRGEFTVDGARISVRTYGYAFAQIDPRPGVQLDAVTAEFHYAHQTGWVLVDLGSSDVGCGSPSDVRAEFSLHCY